MTPVSHGIHPGVGRPRIEQGGPAPDRPHVLGPRVGYRIETFKNPEANDRVFEQHFPGYGTHIFVQELNGSDPIYIRLDKEDAPWIEIEEGDTVVREFDEFWVRSNSRFEIFQPQAQVRARLVVSDGPCVLRAPKKYGFRQGFYTVGGTASDIGVDAFELFGAEYGIGVFPAVMKFGGILVIDNRDTTNDMYAYIGIPGNYLAGSIPAQPYPQQFTSLRIPANQAVSLIFENRIVNMVSPNNDGPGNGNTLVLACETGLTADFAVTVSRFMLDLADPECLPNRIPLKEI
jgi:hypothetical protein